MGSECGRVLGHSGKRMAHLGQIGNGVGLDSDAFGMQLGCISVTISHICRCL
jgi:hypothetical protein